MYQGGKAAMRGRGRGAPRPAAHGPKPGAPMAGPGAYHHAPGGPTQHPVWEECYEESLPY